MRIESLEREATQLVTAGRGDEAIAMVRRHVRLHPRDPELVSLLGVIQAKAGQPDQAVLSLARAAELAPANAKFHNNLGTVLSSMRRNEEAAKAYRNAIARQPGFVAALVGLTAVLAKLGRTAEALETSERAVELAPRLRFAVEGRIEALTLANRHAEALALARAFLESAPDDASMRSTVLFAENYFDRDPQAVLEEHRQFGRHLPAPAPPARRTAPGPLRVGILSSDLRAHSVGFFTEPLLRGRPTDVEFIAFSTAHRHWEDGFTRQLRSTVQGWHEAAELDDAALDALIRSERIDVLLELNGHSSHNRLPALAAQPAPVVVTMIGYPNTTGLPAVGWRVVDSVTDPPDAEWPCTERPLRIDPCFLCYTPPGDAPEPAMPAADAPITFGSFNNVLKVSDRTVKLWAKVLHAVPGSRMLMKSSGQDGDFMRQGLLARFAAHDIPADRILLEPYAAGRDAHLRMYERVHVALDTVPYNGTTTTCEALWMGVPVVALVGSRHAARVSASLLHAAGCDDWVASSPDEYAAIAARLAADRAGLATIRSGLRTQLRGSPLLDAPAYAERLVAALRDLHRGL